MLVAFFDENQASQVMGIAQAMQDVVELKIGGIIIMHNRTSPLRQDPDVFQGPRPPFSVHDIC
jgi:hypothetical protein